MIIDKHKNIIFDSEKSKVNLNILKHKKTFSKQDKVYYGRFLKSRLNEPDEYDPAMFHEFLNDYLITHKITPQPNTLDKFNNGTNKVKPYIEAMSVTKTFITVLLTSIGALIYNYEKIEDFFQQKKEKCIASIFTH